MAITEHRVVGKPAGRVEGPDKTTGTGKYSADINLPGLLWAKILRSPYPHARIVSIDASRAKQLPGVHVVLTGADIPGTLIGRMIQDTPMLCQDVVRFIGDKVAVVAAESPDIAEEAIDLIDIAYEELPAVFDAVEASKPSAPVVHDKFDSYKRGPIDLWHKDYPATEPVSSNLFSRMTWAKGDIEAGYSQADRVFEHHFSTPMTHQAYLEPHACVVWVQEDGHVQVWAHNKQPHTLRRHLASHVGIEADQVTVNVAYIGGDFGGKSSSMDVPLMYLVSKAAGRPVKSVMTYTEELMAADPRHPSTITVKTGVKNDGTIVARSGRVVFNSGAYAGYKTLGYVAGAFQLGGCYNIPNVHIEGDCVYTNEVPRGHARAPGSPQSSFAVESHMDMIAKEMGLDPLEFRLKNVLHDGDTSPSGTAWRQIKAEETLRAAADAIGWGTPKAPNVGRGLALFDHTTGVGNSNANIVIEANGTITVYSPTFDHGTGIHTVQRQIVAEELTVALAQVKVVTVNTDTHPPDGGVGNSRTTHTAGFAALTAVQKLRESLSAVAAEALECGLEEVQLEDGWLIVKGSPERSISIADLASREAGRGATISAYAEYTSNAQDYTSFCTQAAEVRVDPETGVVEVVKIVSAVDSGTIINPASHLSQVEGGMVTGLGFALMEDMPMDEGRVTTLHLGDFKIPNVQDIPPHQTVYVESESGHTPYGGKAVGEITNSSVAPAIANAVADAIGVPITDLPISGERVYYALRK